MLHQVEHVLRGMGEGCAAIHGCMHLSCNSGMLSVFLSHDALCVLCTQSIQGGEGRGGGGGRRGDHKGAGMYQMQLPGGFLDLLHKTRKLFWGTWLFN